MPKHLAFTSIPGSLQRTFGGSDYGEAYQRQCLASWQAAGFDVVSVNSEAEIRALRVGNPRIAFVSNGTEDGRTRIGTILRLAHDSGHRVAGLFNADIFAFSPGRAWEAVLEEAVDSVVVFERLNLDATTMRATGQFCCGFDAFVFDARAAQSLAQDQGWHIGKPFWDYWFPLMMYMRGARIKSLDIPMIAHIEHEQRWSGRDFDLGAKRLALQLQTDARSDRLPASLRARIDALDCSAPDFDGADLWNVIVPWLRSEPARLAVVGAGQDGDFMLRLLAGMSGSKEQELRASLDGMTWRRLLTSTVRRLGCIRR